MTKQVGKSRRNSSAMTDHANSKVKYGQDLQSFGEYMYVEMAHYTDDDTVVLICVSNTNNFEVNEYKLEKLKDKNWQFIIQRFCSGNSSD